jgi:hypothetical protein
MSEFHILASSDGAHAAGAATGRILVLVLIVAAVGWSVRYVRGRRTRARDKS